MMKLQLYLEDWPNGFPERMVKLTVDFDSYKSLNEETRKEMLVVWIKALEEKIAKEK
jgi:hypothetical protein